MTPGLTIFFLYLMLVPLEYLQDKIPKGPTGVNYANIMMALMFGMWFFSRAARRKSPVLRSPLNWLIVAWLVYMFFSMILGHIAYPNLIDLPFNPVSPTAKRFYTFINAFLMFWLGANLFDSRRKIQWAVIAMALAAPLVFRAFYNDLSWAKGYHFSHDMRAAGPFVMIGSNELAAFFVYSGLFFIMIASSMKHRWSRLLMWFAAALYAYGVLYSYSRGAQLAYLAALSLIVIVRYRWVILVVAVAAFTTPMWLPNSVRERWEMTTTDTGELESSAQSREVFWDLALELYSASPITGHGFGTFIHLNPAKMDTHNLYYRTMAEQGTPGIVLLFSLFGGVLMVGYRLWRHGPEKFDRNYGFAMIVATTGLMICNIFGDRFTHYIMIGHYWMIVGLGARLYAGMRGWEPLEDDALAHDASIAVTPGPRPIAPERVGAPGRLAVTSGPRAAPAMSVIGGERATEPRRATPAMAGIHLLSRIVPVMRHLAGGRGAPTAPLKTVGSARGMDAVASETTRQRDTRRTRPLRLVKPRGGPDEIDVIDRS